MTCHTPFSPALPHFNSLFALDNARVWVLTCAQVSSYSPLRPSPCDMSHARTLTLASSCAARRTRPRVTCHTPAARLRSPAYARTRTLALALSRSHSRAHPPTLRPTKELARSPRKTRAKKKPAERRACGAGTTRAEAPRALSTPRGFGECFLPLPALASRQETGRRRLCS